MRTKKSLKKKFWGHRLHFVRYSLAHIGRSCGHNGMLFKWNEVKICLLTGQEKSSSTTNHRASRAQRTPPNGTVDSTHARSSQFASMAALISNDLAVTCSRLESLSSLARQRTLFEPSFAGFHQFSRPTVTGIWKGIQWVPRGKQRLPHSCLTPSCYLSSWGGKYTAWRG